MIATRSKIVLFAAAAITLAVCGWCLRRNGIAIGKISERVKETGDRVKQLEHVVAIAKKRAEVETKKLVAKNADYRAARSKIQVKGDSVIADGKRLELPSVASALVKADSLSVQVPPTVIKEAAKDSVNLVFFKAVDAHDTALEQAKRPWCGRKCGIALGVVGTGATLYLAARIIRAVVHK